MALPKHHVTRLSAYYKNTAVIILLSLLCAIANLSLAQTDNGKVKSILTAIDNYNTKFGTEKFFITFDKPYYAVGDTIWFKAYLLNGANKQASIYSNKIYVELLNDSSQVRERLVIPINAGLGYGDFKLATNMADGAYSVRAYTNWMQNFGEAQFFHQRFYIGKPTLNSWLISEQHQTTADAQNKKINMAMRISNTNGRPIVGEPVTVRLLDGRKGVAKADVVTGVDGSINTDLLLPKGTDERNLSLIIINKQQAKPIKIPFYMRSGSDIDLQFMPEGGELVAGLYNKIAFKAIGEDGLGVDITGSITDSKGEELSTFKSLHKGMGNFTLVPIAGETYTAKMNLPDGQFKTYPLPIAKPSGIAMRADAVSNKDTLRLYISGTSDKVGNEYYLIARSQGTAYFGTTVKLNNGAFNTRIPTSKFPTGILNLMVLDAGQRPVLSRNVFIDHDDRIRLSVVPDKPVYAINDSISLNILAVTGVTKSPLQGNFTVSVTDDALVDDNKREQHIGSYFLLTSELNGHIEDAEWYFGPDRSQTSKALDNLLLTQGWTGATMDKILAKNSPSPTFWAENDNFVEGELRNFFNRPAAKKQITLMNNRKDIFVIDTLTDDNGHFRFDGLPFSDTTAYTLKVHNSNGKEAAVGIKVKEFQPAPAPPADSVRMMPWYANTDSTLLKYLKTSEVKLSREFGPVDAKGNALKQVNIKGRMKARVPGVGGEDIYFADVDIDESVTTKQGNISIYTFLTKNYPGFHVGQTKYGELLVMKSGIVVNISVDSVWVSRYYTRLKRYHEFLVEMLDNIPAAAVKNLVVYHKPTPNNKDWMAFIMIKTRMGNGPVLKETPGIYIYRPLPLYVPREFYRPKYTVKDAPLADARATIHWEPNLVTDEHGNAKLSFYAADKPGTYTVSIAGSDMQGHFGTSKQNIVIAPANGGK